MTVVNGGGCSGWGGGDGGDSDDEKEMTFMEVECVWMCDVYMRDTMFILNSALSRED